jgi:membrane associated rhomboid family serine protease
MLAILPPVTRALLLTNVGVFLLELLFWPPLLQWFALWPPGTLFQPWQLVTYAFLHDTHNPLHILLNMFALFMFGTPLERHWGSRRFTTFYFVCVVAAGLTQVTVATFDHSQSPTLGASGGIFGLLLAFAMYFPHQRIMLLFPPIPLPAWLFVSLYGLAELFQGVAGYEPGVAHFAHLGGLLGGAAMILFWRAVDGKAQR